MRDYQGGNRGWGPLGRFWIGFESRVHRIINGLDAVFEKRELRVTLRFGRKDQDFNLGHERFHIPIRYPGGKAE